MLLWKYLSSSMEIIQSQTKSCKFSLHITLEKNRFTVYPSRKREEWKNVVLNHLAYIVHLPPERKKRQSSMFQTICSRYFHSAVKSNCKITVPSDQAVPAAIHLSQFLYLHMSYYTNCMSIQQTGEERKLNALSRTTSLLLSKGYLQKSTSINTELHSSASEDNNIS